MLATGPGRLRCRRGLFAAAAGGINNRCANEQQAEGQQSEAASEGCDRHQVCTEERSGEISEFKFRATA